MKKLLCALTCLMLLLAAFPCLAESEKTVASFEELKAALEAEGDARIVVDGNLSMIDSLPVRSGKTLVVPKDAALTLNGPAFIGQPIFLVLVIEEGGALDVAGALNTVNHFAGQFVIATVFVGGGTIILRDTARTDSAANLNYGAGEVNLPDGGLPAGFDINWRLEDAALGLDELNEALQRPFISSVTVAIDLEIKAGQTVVIPDGKRLNVEGSITVEEGGAVQAENEAAAPFGFKTVRRDGKTMLLPLN